MEEWRDISGYEGWYQVSNLGRVRSLPRVVPHITKGGVVSEQHWESKILRPTKTNSGYYTVVLSKNGKFSYPTIHRLVAQAFITNSLNKRILNHIDGDKSNNRVENLEWCTYSENLKHAWDQGLRSKSRRRRGISG